jgi:hypothetical protein
MLGKIKRERLRSIQHGDLGPLSSGMGIAFNADVYIEWERDGQSKFVRKVVSSKNFEGRNSDAER